MGCYIMAMSHGTHNANVLDSSKATLLPEYVSLIINLHLSQRSVQSHILKN